MPPTPAPAMQDGDKHDPQRLARPAPAGKQLVCPECRATVGAAAYETHLRTAHHQHVFRGARRSYTETLALLLNLLTESPPDAEAWAVLAALMRDEHGARAGTVLAALVGALLSRVVGDRRSAAVDGLAELIARGPHAALTAALAAADEVAGRRLALALIAKQAPPFDPAMLPPLRVLLLDRRLPVEAQLAAVAALVRSAGPESPLAAEMLHKLVGGLARTQAVERLREFERLQGPSKAIDALRVELEDQLRMSCPRCPALLRRPAMIRHLWDEHKLILDGRRVRDPWGVVEAWLIEYRATGDAELLERCRIRGEQLDPEGGPHRVHRLLLRTGSADAEARRDLLGEARRLHASLCPWCYALAPQPREAPPLAVNLRPGRLSAAGYAVETSSQGLWNILEIRAGGRVLHHGREGWMYLTRRTALLVLAGPWVLAALVAAVWADSVIPAVALGLVACWRPCGWSASPGARRAPRRPA